MQKSGQTFLTRFMKTSMVAVRPMSTAASIQARFEQAYTERTAALKNKTVVT